MSEPDRKNWKYVLALGVLLVAGLFLYMALPSGEPKDIANQEQDQKEDGGKRKKKPLPDFLTRTPVLLPGVFQKNVASSEEQPEALSMDIADRVFANPGNSAVRFNQAKAGHWYSAHYPVVANHFDVDGELTAQTVLPTRQPVPIPHTRYWPSHKRPVALAKKEWKNLETSVFVPVRTDTQRNAQSVLVSFSLNQRNATLNQASTIQPVSAMKAFQHHFVVLSDRPDRWSFLKLTDSFQLKGQLGNGELRPPTYLLVPSIPGDPVPLSRNPLQWTTVAYVLWDNLPADALDIDQQSAMIDWLHHGGQLIISGPDGLDKLQTSFLANYLPASFDGSIELTADEVKPLNENWSIPATQANKKRELTIPPTRPISGIRFEPHEASQFIDQAGNVAIERQIGRGRIVMTAFSLASRRVRGWRSFQSFLNGALLRKPSRTFNRDQSLEVLFSYNDDGTSMFDPLLGSTVRFLSRDLGVSGTQAEADSLEVQYRTPAFANGRVNMGVSVDQAQPSGQRSTRDRNQNDTWHYGGYQDQPIAGVGGWNDFSGVAQTARRALREGAGIKPPSADFVLKMLVSYLLILVPLNWLFFRLIGKVEYAWIAAPIIAVAGAIGVVRMASLDIGFVRSNTELGLLEVFADHPRAHLTQYSALYTSLTTRYQADLDNATSQALPFAASKGGARRAAKERSLSNVTLRRSVQNRLEDLQVQSNSTGLLHTETMLDLEGAFSASLDTGDKREQPTLISNGSTVGLEAAGVIHRSPDGDTYSVAWIGELPPNSNADLTFKPTGMEDRFQAWKLSDTLSSHARRARTIWENNVPKNRFTVRRLGILAFPELQSDLPRYERLTRLKDDSLEANGWSFDDFRDLYTTVKRSQDEPDENHGAGDLFDVVSKNLALSPGESRLLGVTQQVLGLGKLTPEATQTRRQTLVVVHLSHPKLPPARRDQNAYEDKSNLSDLDLKAEADSPEESFEGLVE